MLITRIRAINLWTVRVFILLIRCRLWLSPSFQLGGGSVLTLPTSSSFHVSFLSFLFRNFSEVGIWILDDLIDLDYVLDIRGVSFGKNLFWVFPILFIEWQFYGFCFLWLVDLFSLTMLFCMLLWDCSLCKFKIAWFLFNVYVFFNWFNRLMISFSYGDFSVSNLQWSNWYRNIVMWTFCGGFISFWNFSFSTSFSWLWLDSKLFKILFFLIFIKTASHWPLYLNCARGILSPNA